MTKETKEQVERLAYADYRTEAVKRLTMIDKFFKYIETGTVQ